jgi:single-strand DNA-binding protein
MNDTITTTGVVATVPRHIVTSEGLAITSFRLAAVQRRLNRTTRAWENGDTNWFTVSAFRQLASNTATSVHKGDRVVVTGRLRVRRWEVDSKSGLVVEIDADTVGHDLNWGTASWARSARAADAQQAEQAERAGHGAEPARAFVPDDGEQGDGEGWAPSEPAMALA